MVFYEAWLLIRWQTPHVAGFFFFGLVGGRFWDWDRAGGGEG